jgi:tRNA threonylcarbamoyladenosine biosynthesis protein TsaB
VDCTAAPEIGGGNGYDRDMLILAIDTALEACAVALLDSETNSFRAHESQPMARGHAEALMPMIDRVMKAAELPFTALDRIAVTVGPGVLPPARRHLGSARAGSAAEKPVVGVTTLRPSPHHFRIRRTDHLLIDARHDHVYMQVVGGDGAPLARPRVVPTADIFAHVQLARRGSSATPRPWLIAGLPTRPRRRRRAAGAPDIGWSHGSASRPIRRRRAAALSARGGCSPGFDGRAAGSA